MYRTIDLWKDRGGYFWRLLGAFFCFLHEIFEKFLQRLSSNIWRKPIIFHVTLTRSFSLSLYLRLYKGSLFHACGNQGLCKPCKKQTRNQLWTPEVAKSFLWGAQIFHNYFKHFTTTPETFFQGDFIGVLLVMGLARNPNHFNAVVVFI